MTIAHWGNTRTAINGLTIFLLIICDRGATILAAS
jgi:hypothetical protein